MFKVFVGVLFILLGSFGFNSFAKASEISKFVKNDYSVSNEVARATVNTYSVSGERIFSIANDNRKTKFKTFPIFAIEEIESCSISINGVCYNWAKSNLWNLKNSHLTTYSNFLIKKWNI